MKPAKFLLALVLLSVVGLAEEPFKPAGGQDAQTQSSQQADNSVLAGGMLLGGAGYLALRLFFAAKNKAEEEHQACLAFINKPKPQPSFWDGVADFFGSVGETVGDFFAGIGKAVGDFFAGIAKAVGDFVNWVVEHPWETISTIGIIGLVAATGGWAAPLLGLGGGATLTAAAGSLFVAEAFASVGFMAYRAITGTFTWEDALYGGLNLIPYVGGAAASALRIARNVGRVATSVIEATHLWGTVVREGKVIKLLEGTQESRGLAHILRGHSDHFKVALDVNSKEEIRDIVLRVSREGQTVKKGIKNGLPFENIEQQVVVGNKQHTVRVIINPYTGEIITAHPV